MILNRGCSDQDLLMFAHGQLSSFRSLMVRLHAGRCPTCRSRLAKYSRLSMALSVALASPAGPKWIAPVGLRLILSKGLLLGILAVGLIGSFLSMNRTAAATPPPTSLQNPEAHSCRISKPPTTKAVAPETMEKCAPHPTLKAMAATD
ncbi:MAG: hypothetical protein IT203_05375 [Fimbriimonadaceae bacterium]|nr:hypothetical protein [Fimbriimonadaceae bacterium]